MIQLSDLSTWPKYGTDWLHRNGNAYRVMEFTNIGSVDQEKYPTTIVYFNLNNGRYYSRPLMDWDRSMSVAP